MKKIMISAIAGIFAGIAITLLALGTAGRLNRGKRDVAVMQGELQGTTQTEIQTESQAITKTEQTQTESQAITKTEQTQTESQNIVQPAQTLPQSSSYHAAQSQPASQPVHNQPAQGQLYVNGSRLTDASGQTVQLRGVSTHGLAWFPEYVNYDAFRTLKEDWNANVVRLAMYTDEYGGYCNGGDRAKLKSTIDAGVDYATQLGMYVIIDWHILNDNNPQTHKQEAISFFSEMSAKYADHTNVIYEICNEPHWVSWNNDIKPYAQEVINAIRANDSRALILVGTNTWSQDVHEVIGNELDDKNVMYVMHFYAATHKEWLRERLTTAKNAGLPVFVSECSICDASGNGGIDYESANAWLSLMNDNDISFLAWSLCNKNETSALIRPECNKKSDWEDSDLTDTGKWFKNAIKQR